MPKQIEIVTHEIPIEIIKEVEVPRKEDNYGLMKLLLRNLFWAASSLIWNTVTTHPVAVIEAIAALTVVSVFILKVFKGRHFKETIKSLIGLNKNESAGDYKSQPGKPCQNRRSAEQTKIIDPAFASAIANIIVSEKSYKPVIPDPGPIANSLSNIKRYFFIYENYLKQFDRIYWKDNLICHLPEDWIDDNTYLEQDYEDIKKTVLKKFDTKPVSVKQPEPSDQVQNCWCMHHQ